MDDLTDIKPDEDESNKTNVISKVNWQNRGAEQGTAELTTVAQAPARGCQNIGAEQDTAELTTVIQAPSRGFQNMEAEQDTADLTTIAQVPSRGFQNMEAEQDTAELTTATQAPPRGCQNIGTEQDTAELTTVIQAPARGCQSIGAEQDTADLTTIAQVPSRGFQNMEAEQDTAELTTVTQAPSRGCQNIGTEQDTAELTTVTQAPSRGCQNIEVEQDTAELTTIAQAPSRDCQNIEAEQDTAKLTTVIKAPSRGCQNIEAEQDTADLTTIAQALSKCCQNMDAEQDTAELTTVAQAPSKGCQNIEAGQDTAELTTVAQTPSKGCQNIEAEKDTAELTTVTQAPSKGCQNIDAEKDTAELTTVTQAPSKGCQNIDAEQDTAELTTIARVPSRGCHNMEAKQDTAELTSIAQAPSRGCQNIGVEQDTAELTTVAQVPSRGGQNIQAEQDTAEMTTVTQAPSRGCHSMEAEQDTVELTTVAQVPPRGGQIDCNLNECLLNVYDNARWADMSIRCGEKDTSRSLKAHKVILAARSPIFEAILFGSCSEGKTEYEFPGDDVEIFDKMLRFMYNDNVTLTSLDDATDLMQMAHMYQIERLVNHCAYYLQKNRGVSNICRSLDCALKYNSPTLRDACCDFIDNNVEEVMQTEGFLNISNECLTYLLKGDTFFADEDVVFRRVEEWAHSKLSELGREVNGQNIRSILGDAFYHLRLPTMPPGKLMECIKRKGLFSFDEYEDIVDCIVERQSQLNFVSNVQRVQIEDSLTVSPATELMKSQNIVQVLEIEIDKDIQLEYIDIPFIPTFMNYSSDRLYRNDGFFKNSYTGPIEGQELPYSLNPIMTVVVTLDKINFENCSKVHQLSNESTKIEFDKPVLLKKRDSPFDLTIKIEPTCKDYNVLLVGTYGPVRSSSISKVLSVSQTKESLIGIHSIGIRNCSFREETTD